MRHAPAPIARHSLPWHPADMTKAVFIASDHSPYKDRPGEAYHFPNQYRARVAQTLGDWIVLYAGRRGGSRGYYAVQKVAQLIPDPSDQTHSYALLDRGSLLDFETEVPRLRPDGAPYETGLPLSRGSNTAAVRLISDADFAVIVTEGIRADDSPDSLPRRDMAEPAATFAPAIDPDALRDRVLTSRAFRDASFARQVKRAYDGRCAMSGLALRNGGGRAEVDAAHIVAVAENGPDVVQNGLALSGTRHWMFDRGLVAVDSDHNILVAKGSVADEVVTRLLTPDRKLILPTNPHARPHAAFLDWHRNSRFKG